MGTFSLCVEATVRDVNALLELHKVHPQVRCDVRRRFAGLIEQSYQHAAHTQSGYQESSEQVCHAIASELIRNTLTVAIPRAELAVQEKENAALRQQIVELKEQLAGETEKSAEAARVLVNFKTAHDYMLHSYFREVLILRHRIHDMETRMKHAPGMQRKGRYSVNSVLANLPQPASSTARHATHTQSPTARMSSPQFAGAVEDNPHQKDLAATNAYVAAPLTPISPSAAPAEAAAALGGGDGAGMRLPTSANSPVTSLSSHGIDANSLEAVAKVSVLGEVLSRFDPYGSGSDASSMAPPLPLRDTAARGADSPSYSEELSTNLGDAVGNVSPPMGTAEVADAGVDRMDSDLVRDARPPQPQQPQLLEAAAGRGSANSTESAALSPTPPSLPLDRQISGLHPVVHGGGPARDVDHAVDPSGTSQGPLAPSQHAVLFPPLDNESFSHPAQRAVGRDSSTVSNRAAVSPHGADSVSPSMSTHDMLRYISGQSGPRKPPRGPDSSSGGGSGGLPRGEEGKNSVDAIFDYEAYIALLNGVESESAFEQRMREARVFGGHGVPSPGGVARAQGRGVAGRDGMYGKGRFPGQPGMLRGGDVLMSHVEEELLFYKTKASKMQWCMQFAVRPVKFELSARLDAIRNEVKQMQLAQADFFATMQDAVALLQSRSDALVEVFHLFMGEVLHLLSTMKKDASTKNCAELFLNSGKHKNKLEAIFSTEKDSPASTSLRATAGLTNDEDLAQLMRRRFAPWQHHAVTVKARKTLAELEAFSDKLRRKRAYFLSKGGDGMEQGYRNLFHRSGSTEQRPHGSVTWAPALEAAEEEGSVKTADSGAYGDDSTDSGAVLRRWREALVEGDRVPGMTGATLMQELVKLRLRRAVSRVRRSHVVNRLLYLECELEERDGQSADACRKTHQLFSDVCKVYEGSIQRGTHRIRELLAILARHIHQHGGLLSDQLYALLTAEIAGDGADGKSDAARGEFYSSPYFYNNAFVGPNGDGGPAARRQPAADRVLYVPVGTSAESYIIFQNEQVPISSFVGPAGGQNGQGRTYSEIRTPYGAAVDYCNGVQRGMPVGDRFGPVFLTQHPAGAATRTAAQESPSYTVTDAQGTDLMEASAAAARQGLSTTAALRGEGQGVRTDEAALWPQPATLPMTQILFPAPAPLPGTTRDHAISQPPALDHGDDGTTHRAHPYVYHTAPVEHGSAPLASGAAEPPTTAEALYPLYLVPLTTPATDREQALVGFGHTAASQLFAIPAAGEQGAATGVRGPTAASYAHLLDPTGGARFATASGNPFLHEPPRVLRPPTEEQHMLRIQSLQRPPPVPQKPPLAPAASAAAPGPLCLHEPQRLTPELFAPPEMAHQALPETDMEADAAVAEATPSTAPVHDAHATTATTTTDPVIASDHPLASFDSALQRAKERRSARLQQEAASARQEKTTRGASWVRQRQDAADLGPREKFLRLRLPGSGRLAPIKPSARDTAMLQRKLRVPTVATPTKAEAAATVATSWRRTAPSATHPNVPSALSAPHPEEGGSARIDERLPFQKQSAAATWSGEAAYRPLP